MRASRIKKILAVICLFAGISFLCLQNIKSGTDTGKVTVRFSSWGSESELKILAPLLAEFEKENPEIKVDFLHIPQNYFQKLHLLFASNTAPDALFINNQYLPLYAAAGVLEDLTGYKEFGFENFYPASLKALSSDGKLYAVPRDISVLVLYFNKDLLDKYKVPYPKDGMTYDEFLVTAQKLSHPPDVYGISFEEEPLFYLPYLMSFGLEGIPRYEDSITRKGLNIYADLRNKYHVAPRKEETGGATSAQMFLSGKLGMHLSGRWLVPKYRTDAKFDWDVVSFPKGSSGSVMNADASGWAISKESRHKPEAVKLIKFLSSKKSSEEFAKSGLIVPARRETAESESFLNGLKPKNSKVFLTVAENSVQTPVTADYRKVIEELKTKTEYLFAGKTSE